MSDDAKYLDECLRLRGGVSPDPDDDRAIRNVLNALAAARAEVEALTPPPHERWVRMSPELLAQLQDVPSGPLSVVVSQEKERGELVLTLQRRYDVEQMEEGISAARSACRAAVIEGRLRVDAALAEFGYDSMEFAEARAVWLNVIRALKKRLGDEMVQGFQHEAVDESSRALAAQEGDDDAN